jgi:uncharacterized protein
MTTFQIPVRELRNRPGQMRELQTSFVLEAPLETAVVKLPAGAAIEADLRLESVHEGVLATADLSATAHAVCCRCLEDMNLEIRVDFQELFAYSGQSDDDLLVVNDLIDLEQPVIDSVVSSLPFKPICSESCLGLCAECGFLMADDPEHGHLAPIDSRWSDLQKLQTEEE